jgi:hypothetical protein
MRACIATILLASMPAFADEPTPDPDQEAGAELRSDQVFARASRGRDLWHLEATHELHFNLVSDDYSAADWLGVNVWRGDWNPTEHDQVSLRVDAEQAFIADAGESGWRFGDMRLYYSRLFVPEVRAITIPLKASIYLTAPTSRVSQERGYVTKPTAVLTASPSFGRLKLIGQGVFQYAFARYRQSSGGESPNTQLTTGFYVQASYAVTDWFAPSLGWQSLWNLPYASREGEGQSLQQEYLFEAALNFAVPMPTEAPTVDVSLTYAQGSNVLEDGVYRMYFAKRDQSELYLTLTLGYGRPPCATATN